ncbi:hypothetical protein [Fusobacterium sp.]|uniref:hypothetical protein n=1 Tax=Fusobacterium sp. TaxID=68766 RepID=UPI00260C22F2|nr:hypothetical protein [Fusobacterium sp.]
MINLIILYLYVLVVKNSYGEFKEVVPLEASSDFKMTKVIKKQPLENREIKKIEEKKRDEDIVQVIEEEELEDSISNESVPIISEARLKEIISESKDSPLPQNEVEINSNTLYSINAEKNSGDGVFQSLEETLDKYEFSDKSNDSYGGKVTSTEITSDKLIDNLEFGVGVAYENDEYYNGDERKQNTEVLSHTPVYAIGKYKIAKDEESVKYLKLNLGYAIGDYTQNREYENKTQNGLYYGIGGGMEFDKVSLDLMYQVNKDAYEKKDSTQDDSRITFSVDYKLDI